MVLDKEHGTIRFNSSLTLAGIDAETFQYVLGTRSVLERSHGRYPPTLTASRRSENPALQGKMVGARGFEPPTPWSRTRCATRLRYAPTEWNEPSLGSLLGPYSAPPTLPRHSQFS